MNFLILTFLTLIASLPQLQAHTGKNPYIDLHAHLFMKEGMGPLFIGDFNGPLRATSWKDKLYSGINDEALNESGLGLVVVALYALPGVVDTREAIRRQIKLANDFVAKNPRWVIARSPKDAKVARSKGKRILVLSLENVDNVIETDEDIKEFVIDKGIAIVTFAHLLDNEWTGCSMLRGAQGFGNFFKKIQLTFTNKYISEGVKYNPKGLTPAGKKLAQKLINHGVWLDLTHASEPATKALLKLIDGKQPPLYTHTALREFYQAERGLAKWQLEEVRRNSGMIGLIPGHDFMEGTHVPSCRDDLEALVTHWNIATEILPPEAVAIGSDFNGALKHLAPTKCNPTDTSLDKTQGLWNISQTKEMWQSLSNRNARIPSEGSEKIIDHFIETWGRVYKVKR